MERSDDSGDGVTLPTCPLCNGPIEPGQQYCSHCQQVLSSNAPLRPAAAGKPKWYYNIWFVLLMLIFVLGPLGLPLVWKNPTFPRWLKITLTLAMVAYTVLLIDATLKAVAAVMNQMQQFNATF
jgi:predicted nucleic acid-binding Zn ribbon protein